MRLLYDIDRMSLGILQKRDLDLLLHYNLLDDKRNMYLEFDQHCSQRYDSSRKQPKCERRLTGTVLLND